MSYLTLAPGPDRVAEIEVKRSRFRAVLRRVDDEPAARELVAELRRTHRDARHHCTAFILGPEPHIERSNDDGEPAGTAGGPMLDVLRGHELSDVSAVVVRWFGGTLLGAGGLVRAYGEAVTAALEGVPLVRRTEEELFDLPVSHTEAGKVEADLRARQVNVLGVDYLDRAVLHLAGSPAELTALVADVTAGRGSLASAGSQWVDRPAASR
ncbi:IMPACT family protein [Calidifontibacter terrae]